MKRILAVSGGVDSMVLLDLMVKKFPREELIVATFDHGTRKSSKYDAEFVGKVAAEYGLKVHKGNAKLGEKVSEDLARKKRYEFLREIAKLEDGEIYTAHHLDDLIESIIINLIRGTGFRGLAVLNADGVKRPFLDSEFDEIFDKKKILEYASENNVAFRQDPTNTSETYLRNRIRPKVLRMTHKEKMKIFELWEKQKKLTKEIDEIVESLIPDNLVFERKWFYGLDENICLEILRAGLRRNSVSATRPQLKDFLKAIKSYQSGKKFNLPNDRFVKIGTRSFKLEA